MEYPIRLIWSSCFCGRFHIPKNYVTFVEDHLMNIPTKLVSNWPSGFREKDKNVQVRDYDGHKVMVIYVPTVTLRVR
jgi:hypothetical protein